MFTFKKWWAVLGIIVKLSIRLCRDCHKAGRDIDAFGKVIQSWREAEMRAINSGSEMT